MANKFLTGITISTAVGGEYTFPIADGSANQAIITDGNGNLSFGSAIASSAEDAQRLVCEMINASGSTIGSFVPVCCVGIHSDGTPEIAPARSDNPLFMPAIGITQSSVGNNNRTDILLYGKLEGINTTPYATGDTLYVAPTGGWSTTRPTGNNLIQAVFKVGRIQQNNGSGGAFGTGQYEDLPNIGENKVWLGNSSSHPVATSLSTAISSVLGYTPANDSLVVHLAGNETITGIKTFSAATEFTSSQSVAFNYGLGIAKGNTPSIFSSSAVYLYSASGNNNLIIKDNTNTSKLQFQASSSYTYTFPASTGTVALTSDIPDLSGYVTLATSQTISGAKTFSNNVKIDSGSASAFLAFKQYSSGSTGTAGFTSIYAISTDTFGISYGAGNDILFKTASPTFPRTYTFPDASGTVALTSDIPSLTGYVPTTRTLTINGTTYDLSADRSWTIEGGGGTSASTRTVQKYTADGSSATYTVTGGYTVGMVDVYVNGIKLDNASGSEFTATNGTTVVLVSTPASGDIVEVYKYGSQFIATNALRQTTLFTATAGQNTFTVNYSVGLVDVFYNGSKLDSSEYTASTGTSIVFNTNCVVGDKVEVVAYTYNATGYTGVAYSNTPTTNYLTKWTSSGVIGNSLIFDNGTNVGIGTSSPSKKLEIVSNTSQDGIKISGSSNPRLTIIDTTNSVQFDALTTDTEAVLRTDTNHPLLLSTNGTERMRITAAGNVLLGSNANSADLSLLTIKQSSTSYNNGIYLERGGERNGYFMYIGGALDALTFRRNYFGTQSDVMSLTRDGNVGIGTSSPLREMVLYRASGEVHFKIANGTTGQGTTDGFDMAIDGSGGAYLINRENQPMHFFTNGTERMRITSGGQVNINSTQTTHPFYVQASIANWMTVMENSASSSSGLLIRQTGGAQGYYYGAYDGSAYKFFVNGSGVVNSTSTSITIISSDKRLKTDIRDYDKGLAEVLAMKPRIYKRKDNLEIDEVGFIAQEMDIALAGSMIESYKDEQGEPIHTYQLEWYPLLVKAIQEQQAQISAQSIEIENLKKLIN